VVHHRQAGPAQRLLSTGGLDAVTVTELDEEAQSLERLRRRHRELATRDVVGAPNAAEAGQQPKHCNDDELSYRLGSPVSAKIAAAPVAVKPGMSPSRARPKLARAATMPASVSRSWARARCRSPSSRRSGAAAHAGARAPHPRHWSAR
jgi:hypothetical protein